MSSYMNNYNWKHMSGVLQKVLHSESFYVKSDFFRIPVPNFYFF